MRRTLVVLVVAFVAVLAGCSSSGKSSAVPPDSAGSPLTSPVLTATTSRAGRVATLQDLDAAYNESIPAVKSALEELPACETLTAPSCDTAHQIAWLGMSLALKTFEVDVQGLSDTRPGNKLYRGAIPDKYAAAVGDALFAAQQLDDDLQQLAPGCVGPAASPVCQSIMDQTIAAAERFADALKKWP